MRDGGNKDRGERMVSFRLEAREGRKEGWDLSQAQSNLLS